MISALETILFNYTNGHEIITNISSLNHEFREEFNPLREERLQSSIRKMDDRVNKITKWMLKECYQSDREEEINFLILQKKTCKQFTAFEDITTKVVSIAMGLFYPDHLENKKIAIILSLDFHMPVEDIQELSLILSQTKNVIEKMLFSENTKEQLNALLMLPKAPPESLVDHIVEKMCLSSKNFLSLFQCEMIPFFAQYEDATNQLIDKLSECNQLHSGHTLLLAKIMTINNTGIYLEPSSNILMIENTSFRDLCILYAKSEFSKYHAHILIDIITKITQEDIVDRAINEYKTTLGLQ